MTTLRSRGVLRTAMTWALGLSALATTLLIVGVELGFVPATVFGIRELVALAARAFVAGGVMGALFALSVARQERGRSLTELSYGRFGASGFIGGAVLGVALGLATPGVLPIGVLVASVIGLGLIGTGFSVATLALARRAEEPVGGQRLENAAQPALPPVIQPGAAGDA
jgi:hypothetical protein